MHPELFRIPFTSLTVKGYGLMLVIGFLLAVHVIRRLSRNITTDPQMITNVSLYSLVAGVIGARVFYILHHFDKFRDNLIGVFAIWEGGLELLGGVLAAIAVIILYLRCHKLKCRLATLHLWQLFLKKPLFPFIGGFILLEFSSLFFGWSGKHGRSFKS